MLRFKTQLQPKGHLPPDIIEAKDGINFFKIQYTNNATSTTTKTTVKYSIVTVMSECGLNTENITFLNTHNIHGSWTAKMKNEADERKGTGFISYFSIKYVTNRKQPIMPTTIPNLRIPDEVRSVIPVISVHSVDGFMA